MCCIFTCCGWMIDLLQRAWVFAMSCCISSAVCCAMITSSMSGVALGYNYSLAEYIDLKETNVSVYMKRGVFDDDIAGDLDWRRRGHQPLPLKDDERDLLTGAPDEPEQMPMDSGRRMENSIVESGDNIKYEGSLMKLTVRPPHPSHTVPPGITPDLQMLQAVSSFPEGSLDQLKAVQEVINMRKMSAARDRTVLGPDNMSTNGYLAQNIAGRPEEPRRMMSNFAGPGLSPEELELLRRKPENKESTGHPARWAIPSGINSIGNWLGPKMAPEEFKKVLNTDDDPPPFLKPGTYATGPIRPPTTTTMMPLEEPQPLSEAPLPSEIVPPDRAMDALQAKIMEGKYDRDRMKGKQFLRKQDTNPDIRQDPYISQDISGLLKNENNIDYYEDDSIMKGLPVRKKRSVNKVKLRFQAKVVPQKTNLDVLTKFKVGKILSNEITDYPSVLVRKLHISNNAESDKTTSIIENEVKGNSKCRRSR